MVLIPAIAQDQLRQIIDERADEIEKQVIEWRRHFHENFKLSNREFKTAEYIAKYLKELGLEVETNGRLDSNLSHHYLVGFNRANFSY